ncbi:hypothetical protein Droror1_Dr00016633 [Drosera rotundifolia]
MYFFKIWPKTQGPRPKAQFISLRRSSEAEDPGRWLRESLEVSFGVGVVRGLERESKIVGVVSVGDIWQCLYSVGDEELLAVLGEIWEFGSDCFVKDDVGMKLFGFTKLGYMS